jgi:hypothetical protein
LRAVLALGREQQAIADHGQALVAADRMRFFVKDLFAEKESSQPV